MDIATLLSAVKPKERTDQYLIFAALFALESHTTSVTSKQIKEILKLHLGAKAPANVNASLRAYSGYVSPTEKGPPLRWSLTAKGVERLRSLSGLARFRPPRILRASNQLSPSSADWKIQSLPQF